MSNFKITIVESENQHFLEEHLRYSVLLNGVYYGEISYNMRGYTGYLPQPSGIPLDCGEQALSSFRRDAAKINHEAKLGQAYY